MGREERGFDLPRFGGEYAYYEAMYAARPEEEFPLPAVPFPRIDPVYYRRLVEDPTGERPGTIVVDTNHHFLYLTQEKGKALRYGVGLGRAGFAWAGRGVILYKRRWPRWTPPNQMVARQPELEPYSIANGGMDPGLNNPLGACALCIFQNGKDTLYRIHGSPEWWSIGTSVSSGCVRMLNQDVIFMIVWYLARPFWLRAWAPLNPLYRHDTVGVAFGGGLPAQDSRL